MTHDDDTCPHLVRANLLEAENARLKAEVEELKSQPDPLTAYLYADTLRRDDIKTLKAHIERLRKAGYAMACKINVHGINDRFTDSQKLVDDWSNAAKEGKQP
jgi:predicted RNase H-like nuclease (RuvC/YqgF family)